MGHDRFSAEKQGHFLNRNIFKALEIILTSREKHFLGPGKVDILDIKENSPPRGICHVGLHCEDKPRRAPLQGPATEGSTARMSHRGLQRSPCSRTRSVGLHWKLHACTVYSEICFDLDSAFPYQLETLCSNDHIIYPEPCYG